MLSVLDHRKAAWYLLAEDDDLYLDVNCNHHAFGYSVLIRLDDRERDRLTAGGTGYLDELAHEVHYSAPIVNERSPYRPRDLSRERSSEVSDAVRRWRESTL